MHIYVKSPGKVSHDTHTNLVIQKLNCQQIGWMRREYSARRCRRVSRRYHQLIRAMGGMSFLLAAVAPSLVCPIYTAREVGLWVFRLACTTPPGPLTPIAIAYLESMNFRKLWCYSRRSFTVFVQGADSVHSDRPVNACS